MNSNLLFHIIYTYTLYYNKLKYAHILITVISIILYNTPSCYSHNFFMPTFLLFGILGLQFQSLHKQKHLFSVMFGYPQDKIFLDAQHFGFCEVFEEFWIIALIWDARKKFIFFHQRFKFA